MVRKNKIIVMVLFAFLAIVSIVAWMKPEDRFSKSERRYLKQFPEVSIERVISGDFMSDFESYVADQFPFRESLRSIKALFTMKTLGQKDHHGIYMVDGYVSKMEYPLNEASVQRATNRINIIYDYYLENTETSVYYAIIPDKNYFIAEANGYLSLDYEVLFEDVRKALDGMNEISILNLLDIEDYYKTDIHWRQENLLDVSGEILQAMGNDVNAKYELKTLHLPFYGVYAGQSALPMQAEQIRYYTNSHLEKCIVYDYEKNVAGTIYDMEKAYGDDPYEMFLSGPISLMTIENPRVETDKELIMFRDSFGSSLAPLLVENYKKMTLVDIRYIHPDLLGKYIEFDDQDVLFIYSTSVLNNGETFK